ncbi:hypothetical protein Godav_024263 [Gossypium davidsonii]|uniref:F-box associated beta-propeller type 1 domain-containing protein n=1 Tax=Gossypium davidsonii TaxID=34287 RepID=A0A7J8SUI4_GOSDV|nr:hypothetical protein [Gossypium davidsonii]
MFLLATLLLGLILKLMTTKSYYLLLLLNVIRFVTLNFFNSEEEHPHPHFMYQVELYSLRSDSRKEIPSPNDTPTGIILRNNYLNGICYWKTEMGTYLDFRALILSFDLVNEKFSILPIPKLVRSFP